jgi:DNA-binding transcriptional MerR regulator
VWTIGEVSRLSGITSRTLRHYDAIGLLDPVGVDGGGRRLYGRAELERLQEVLVLRELGVDLATIAEVLADGERLDHLRAHLARLEAERDRFDRLARAVRHTITSLEKGEEMPDTDLYRGFDNSRYEREARDRWGDDVVDRSNASWESLGPDGQARFWRENQATTLALAGAMRDGVPVDDERTQALVARHYAHTCVFWTPDAQSYSALGRMYVEDARFTATYDAIAPGLAPYLCDAMAVYARTRLG